MKVEELNINGVYLIKPRIFEDDRGYFFESFNQNKFDELIGESVLFLQDNESLSRKNVLRGMHFQKPPHEQGKLVRVIQGAVLDVAVDIRKNSATYGGHVKTILSEKNKHQLWIPPGFAHGFLTLEEDTIFSYKCTGLYIQESEGGLNWNDPELGIDWGLKDPPILSQKDKVEIDFKSFKSPF